MSKITKKLSAIALCTVFASMQMASAAIDTGLGNAVINNATGGYVGLDKGANSATLNFNGNSHVNWDTLNVGKGETLNFNAVNGANNLTIVNTVNKGMTQVYGAINSNEGVGKLIISNPNGMLYDGAKFTTAGDLMLTTQALDVKVIEGKVEIEGLAKEAVNGITIKNSDFSVGGEFNITAPSIEAVKTAVKATKGLKLVTADGQNYLVAPTTSNDNRHIAVRMETVSVNGNVYVLNGKDIVNFVNGGTVEGNLTVESDGNVALNYTNKGEKLNVTGNVNVNNDGRISYLRNAKVDGNVNMSNSGGFIEVGNLEAGKDVNLKTTVKTNAGVKHFVHVIGDNDIKGNLNIDSIHNIHIGGYNDELDTMAPGSLKVGKTLDANAREGSVAVSINTTADKVKLTSGTLNVITDGKANITANEYELKAEHYIGGVTDQDYFIKTVMENYTPIKGVSEKSYLNIEGGKVTKLETGNTGYAFVRANKDMNLNGVKANGVNVAAGGDIKIEDNVHARLIKVDGETRNLTVNNAANKRDYTLRYVNIKDTETIEIAPETEITYEMANGNEGWNKGTQTKENTYLVVPGEPDVPPVEPDVPPVEPDVPPVEPDEPVVPPVQPDKPTINPEDNDNVKIMRNLNPDQMATAVDAQQVYTPVAFAADLDDEVDTGVRKNVDGSVTVVRSYTPVN